MILALIIVFSLLGSLGTVALAGSMLLGSEPVRRRLTPLLVSYAVGALLASALLGLLPHALSKLSAHLTMSVTLAGIVGFFLLEKIVLWRHCHEDGCALHGGAGPLILIGDTFHNFVDGAIIAGAFLTAAPLGIATSIAVISHEIPQEVGDFAILLQSGYRPRRAFLLNTLSSLGTLLGAVVAYSLLAQVEAILPYVMAVSASGFLYVAMADIAPALHRSVGLRDTVTQLGLILLGIGTVALLHGQP